jgi:hypothetical protein
MSISIKVLEDEDSNITKTDWNMIKFWKSEFGVNAILSNSAARIWWSWYACSAYRSAERFL